MVLWKDGQSETDEAAGKARAAEQLFVYGVGCFPVESERLRAIGLLLDVNQEGRILATLPIGVHGDHGAVAADAGITAAGFDGGSRNKIAKRTGFNRTGRGPDSAGEIAGVEGAAACDSPIDRAIAVHIRSDRIAIEVGPPITG